ncbi:MAG: gamma-glutamyl-gamma-aminobutyrate hydrolase family protein [Boseongicola sp.]|nr:gamma-glutamyl-gamma-aminobutyrate hydrolase family protein [Boseongicola sp.]
MSLSKKTLFVIQHTDSEFLGRMEDHFEGRGIRFNYLRPHTAPEQLPNSVGHADGLILLGGGPWGSAGTRDLPSLREETTLVRECLSRNIPVIGIGLGSQILAIAAGGSVEPSDLVFEVGQARSVVDDALNGFLPTEFPLVTYMRDRPVPPDYALVLAEDEKGRPALFQIGEQFFGFAGHPGAKRGMIEDLIMEFSESPDFDAANLDLVSQLQPEIEDALVGIMTGLIQKTGLMRNPSD